MHHFSSSPQLNFLEVTVLLIYLYACFTRPSVFWAHEITVCLASFRPSLRPYRRPSSHRVCVGHLLQRELKAFLCLPCHHGLFNNYPNKVNNNSDATPPFHCGPPTLTLRSDEWGHQACQLPRRWAGCPRRAARPPSQGEEAEQSGKGQGRASMPELTLGRAWTERTSGNMEKHREGWWSRGVQDVHTNRGGSLGASNAVGNMDTLTTCFCSLLAHDFPLLLTTIVPYSTS